MITWIILLYKRTSGVRGCSITIGIYNRFNVRGEMDFWSSFTQPWKIWSRLVPPPTRRRAIFVIVFPLFYFFCFPYNIKGNRTPRGRRKNHTRTTTSWLSKIHAYLCLILSLEFFGSPHIRLCFGRVSGRMLAFLFFCFYRRQSVSVTSFYIVYITLGLRRI